MEDLSHDPLDIIIVGAGIAGLSAAIALRRAGHRVKILEQSDFNNELGAAIHLAPNASRVLLRWGLDPEAERFVTAKNTFIANGSTLEHYYEGNYSDVAPTYGAPWFFAHRIGLDLHNALKAMAMAPEGPGPTPVVMLNSRVIDYDPELGSVTLTNSSVEKADLIVAADGVHSAATRFVLGKDNPALPTDQSVFRFLIPASELAADPETAPLIKSDDGCLKVLTGAKARLVWYSCRNNEIHNFVGIFHDTEKGLREDYDKSVSLDELLYQYRDFHPSILAICRKASSVQKWPLLFRHPISPWHKSKLVLIGDAAHPMLPLQGQAGAQAIEDSVALSVMVKSLTKSSVQKDPNLLEQRLELYEQVRARRASAIQIFSNAGQEESERVAEAVRPYVDGPIPSNPHEFIVFNFGYNIEEQSKRILREAEAAA